MNILFTNCIWASITVAFFTLGMFLTDGAEMWERLIAASFVTSLWLRWLSGGR